jgi:hypothetical protein
VTSHAAVRYLAALGLVACAVDGRSLGGTEPPSPGIVVGAPDAGAPNDTGTDGKSGEPGGAAPTCDVTDGAGGAPSEDSHPTTTTTSWTFDVDGDLGVWQPEAGLEQSFSADDTDGRDDSGSLLASLESKHDGGDFIVGGTSVCVPLESGVGYDIAAWVWIAPDQGVGSGGFDVQFFDGTACDGSLLSLADSLTATSATWVLVEKTPAPVDNARSALFRLVVSKPASDPPFSAAFDDVRFEPQ